MISLFVDVALRAASTLENCVFMNSKVSPEHDEAIKPQNLGPWLMISSQSNLNL